MRWTIVQESGLVRIALAGVATDEGVWAASAALAETPGYAEGAPVLWDLTGCTFSDFTSDAIRSAMAGLETPRVRRGRRSAFLVKNAADGWLMEVWKTLFEEKFGAFALVSEDEDAARAWLFAD